MYSATSRPASACPAPPRPSPSWRGAARTRCGSWRPLGIGFGAFVQGFSGVLKDATQRLRPDPLHHSTYSFPSSHTASATFLAGAFLAVLVPALLDDDEEEFWTWTPTTITSVAGITALTAAGRILTESHFLSDTLAGAALGIGALGRDRVGRPSGRNVGPRRRNSMAWWESPPRLPGSVSIHADGRGINALPRKAQGSGAAPAARRPRDYSRRPRLLRRRLARGHRLLDEVDDRPRAVLQDVLAVRHAQRSVKAFSGGTDFASSPRAALIAAGNLPWWAQARQITGPAPN